MLLLFVIMMLLRVLLRSSSLSSLSLLLPGMTRAWTTTATTTIATTPLHIVSRTTIVTSKTTTTTSSCLQMVQNRGLEIRREGATPTEGGMTLYCKAGPDGIHSIGDCPFCHAVRMVLEEKGLSYTLQPATAETKPTWLTEYYDGKMPALQHGKECYTESRVIMEYLDFFFPQPALQLPENTKSKQNAATAAAAAVKGFFPAVAQYLKHTPDGDAEDVVLKETLQDKLNTLNEHLRHKTFLCHDDDGNDDDDNDNTTTATTFTLEDCQLAPQLYHLQIGLKALKNNAIDIATQYPALQTYMDKVFARSSFQKTLYPAETVVWGWENARNK